ncbi:DUF2721 domain-containing protein [Haloferula rosea]|uniref:DUF2721 domain-containing protein n=1 Tax=Haloferula rosea TaxID=490093 RepID=A0A934VCG1_9BACT|nr:DUF2721 domain-containing protein [Haloferula rosea]
MVGLGAVGGLNGGVTLDVSTPALLFPAISLLFLSFTNRFLHLAALIRQLYRDWLDKEDERLLAQIANLRRRLILIRWMQFLGAVSLFLCVVSMVAVMATLQVPAQGAFWGALVLMGASLACLMVEVWISGGALRIMLRELEEGQ